MVTASSLIWSNEAPLNLPAAWAATTVPEAAAPAGMTVLPSTSTGLPTVAENACPASLVLELRVSPRRTVITVPDGTTIGGASRGACFEPPAILLGAMVPPGPFASPLLVSLAGGLLEHASRLNIRYQVRVSTAKRERMRNLQSKKCIGNALVGANPKSRRLCFGRVGVQLWSRPRSTATGVLVFSSGTSRPGKVTVSLWVTGSAAGSGAVAGFGARNFAVFSSGRPKDPL